MSAGTNALSAYQRLESRFREAYVLRSIAGTLEWDRYVWLPEGAASMRTDQVALLERLISDRIGAADVADLLDRAGQEPLTPWQQANLYEMRRDHVHAGAIDPALTSAWLHATSECERTWRSAREQRDPAAVLRKLEIVVALTRERAIAKAQSLGTDPYEALLDRWEPGLRMQALRVWIDEWRSTLPPIAEAISEAPCSDPLPVVPVERQRSIVPLVLQRVGFDLRHGLIAESTQPCFSDDTPDDVRITVRYNAERPLEALRGGLHETGHSFYERQVPEGWRYQPVGRPRSASLQESQALLWEVHVGGSDAFHHWLAPQLAAGFGWHLTARDLAAGWQGNNLRRDRLDSGEVGYLLHLLVRTELELRLIAGELSARDLLEAWFDATSRWLGSPPAPDAMGPLADIHWYRGLFGYFPSYLIGAALAAQLMEAARAAMPTLDDDLTSGQFQPLRAWLRDHVHTWGSSVDASTIVQRATGHSLSGAALVRHLQRRHLGATNT